MLGSGAETEIREVGRARVDAVREGGRGQDMARSKV